MSKTRLVLWTIFAVPGLVALAGVLGWLAGLAGRALHAPVWYGQLALALAVATLAAWFLGRGLISLLCLRVMLAARPLWRFRRSWQRTAIMLLSALATLLVVAPLGEALFASLAPERPPGPLPAPWLLTSLAWPLEFIGDAALRGLSWVDAALRANGWCVEIGASGDRLVHGLAHGLGGEPGALLQCPGEACIRGLVGWAPACPMAAIADAIAIERAAFDETGAVHAAAVWASRVAPVVAVLLGYGDVGAVVARARALVGEKHAAQGIFEENDPFTPKPGTAPKRGPGRNIIILCDGASNSAHKSEDGQPALTNIVKLHRALLQEPGQVVLYLPGVGSGETSSEKGAQRVRDVLLVLGPNIAGTIAGFFSRLATLAGNAFGTGITGNIVAGYTEIVRQYRPGDRIYLMGFSRGAYTARCIAGVIRRCGLLKPGNYHLAEDAVRLYLTRREPDARVPLEVSLIHPPMDIAIEFVGLFDTVGSLGAPLWGWWFNLRSFQGNRNFGTDPSPIIRHVCHAMAMDERRSQFFPTPFTWPRDKAQRGWTETLEQVWFRGAHADIGGGYVQSGLSDITLSWMYRYAERFGLRFQPDFAAGLKPDPLAPLHDELVRNPGWRIFGSWPRWHPVPGNEEPLPIKRKGSDWEMPGRLHTSVHRRAAARAAAGRPDFRRSGAAPIGFQVLGVHEWDRTGIVLKKGETYQLTWLGQDQWRDALKPACGPAGQPSGGWRTDWLRRATAWHRRLPRQDWMTLCATVAHPRDWPLREFPLWRAFWYLFVRDPLAMRRQVAPLGQALQPGGSLTLLYNGPADGMLHCFANDWWQTAGNNSGQLDLEIRLLPTGPAKIVPDMTLNATHSRIRGRRVEV